LGWFWGDISRYPPRRYAPEDGYTGLYSEVNAPSQIAAGRVNVSIQALQSACNSGKPGKLREFFNSGKLGGKTHGILNLLKGIFVSVIVGIEFCA